MIKRWKTYCRYFWDYLNNGEFILIFVLTRYLLFGIPLQKDRLCRSSIGIFSLRAGTNDFQFPNLAYEYDVTRFFMSHYKDYDVFIDIGAHIGRYTIMMANKNVHCIAFEPMAENYESLRKNVTLNHLGDKIRTFNIGLGAEDTQQGFFLAPVNKGASHSAAMARRKVNYQDHILVNTEIRTLDNMASGMNVTGKDKVLIKIDAEGMECEILRGAANFLGSLEAILMIIESKHSGEQNIRSQLDLIGGFRYGIIDAENMTALKTPGFS